MCFFFQAEDGIRYLVRSRGLGDVYKRQVCTDTQWLKRIPIDSVVYPKHFVHSNNCHIECSDCLLYTSDAADERSSVDLGGRRIIKKKKKCRTRETRTCKVKTERHTTNQVR